MNLCKKTYFVLKFLPCKAVRSSDAKNGLLYVIQKFIAVLKKSSFDTYIKQIQ